MTKRDAKDEKKAPKLRFKGFTDDWEQRHLGNNASFSKGSGYSKADLREKGTPIILYGRLYTNYQPIIDKIDTFVEKKNGSVYSQAGDVIVPGSGETAEDISVASVVKNSGVILGGDLNVIHPNSKLDSLFLALSISNGSSHKDMARRAQGKSIVHLHINDLEQIKSYFPSIEEQKKIGQLFQSLDRTITLHEEKQKQLEQLKKALLQKMFADKAGYPELRFTGFSGHWEQKKLKEVAEINPKTSIPKKFMYVDLESVSGTNLLSTKLIDKDVAPSRAQRTAQKGDIFYQTVRPYQKNNYLFELSDPLHPYVFSTGYAQIRTEQISNTFLFNILQQQSFVNKVLVRCTGTSYPAITGKELEKIKISTPLSLKEQEKIGQLFQHLDHTITLHAKKINQLKSLKQALLQQMFI